VVNPVGKCFHENGNGINDVSKHHATELAMGTLASNASSNNETFTQRSPKTTHFKGPSIALWFKYKNTKGETL
jgi:hypothetical protein